MNKNSEIEKEYKLKEEANLPLANGMLLHNDHVSTSDSANVVSDKRSNLTAPTVLRYPRGG